MHKAPQALQSRDAIRALAHRAGQHGTALSFILVDAETSDACAGLLAGGTGVTAMINLSTVILKNPNDKVKVGPPLPS